MSEAVKFSLEEDFLLFKLVRLLGCKRWKIISMYFSKFFPENTKNSKLYKNRWFNHLEPKFNKKGWSLIEEYIFFESRRVLGNKWAVISKFLPGRTDNNIKNHFYSTFRKNIGRFTKGKYNYSCIKDKIKSFYTLMHTRDKFLVLKNFYDEKQNKVDLTKAKEFSNEITGNYDDQYISDLICQNKGSLKVLNTYINKLCYEIILDDYNPNNQIKHDTSIVNKFFDIENKVDFLKIQSVLSAIANKSAISSSIKYLSAENFEEITKDSNRLTFTLEKNKMEKVTTNPTPNANEEKVLIEKNRTESVYSKDNNYEEMKGLDLSNLIEDFIDKNPYMKQLEGNNNAEENQNGNYSIEDIISSVFSSNNEDNKPQTQKYIVNNNNNNNTTENYQLNMDNFLQANSLKDVMNQLKVIENYGMLKNIIEKLIIQNIIKDFIAKKNSEKPDKRLNQHRNHNPRRDLGKFKNLLRKYYMHLEKKSESNNNNLLTRKMERMKNYQNCK